MTTEHRSFCRICLATCGIVVSVDDDARVVAVRGRADDPVSHGYVCPKGRGLAELNTRDRLTSALVRTGDEVRQVSSAEGIADAAQRLAKVIEEHGPGSVATFMGTGGFSDPTGTWAANRLKALLGLTQTYSTSTVDAVSKVLVGHVMAGTGSLIPHPDADCRLMLLVGSNPVVSHGQSTPFANPIERIRAAREQGEVWVIDPRRTETAALADRHLGVRAGTDHAVLAFLVRTVLADGADRVAIAERADGIDELAEAVKPYDRDRAAAISGLSPDELDDLAAAVLRAGRLAVVTGTGTSMSRAAYLTEWMAWALMIVTDSFDAPGGMWFNPGYHIRLDQRRPLRELPIDLPGPPSRPDILSLFGEWPAALIPEEIEAGRLKALLVIGGNPATALPHTERLHRALRQLDVLLVADVAPSQTTALATHAFGVADQLERPDHPSLDLFGTVLATRWTDAVLPTHPERPEMWRLFARLGQAMGLEVLDEGESADTTSTEDLIRRLKPAIDIDAIREAGGVIVDAPAVYGWVLEHLPWGRWRLAPQLLVDQLDAFPEIAPLVLAPRRQARRMNGLQYREGDRAEAIIHPKDAASEGVTDGDLVEVSSAAGTVRLHARVTDGVAIGTVSIAHGWGGDANVNLLVSSEDIDPITGMPAMSGTAVRVRVATPA